MPIFNDIEVSNDFCRQIEDGNLQTAKEIWLSNHVYTEDAADFLFSEYTKSTNQENWLKFFDFVILNFRWITRSQLNLIVNVLKLSIESGKNEFLLAVLKHNKLIDIDKNQIIRNLIFRDTVPDFLQQMIFSASTLNSDDKDLFFQFLISYSFRRAKTDILMFLNEHYGIEFLKSQINTILQDKLLSSIVRHSIQNKKFPPALMTTLFSLFKASGDYELCYLILKTNFQDNNTLFIDALMQEGELHDFITLFQNMGPQDQDIIIKSLAMNMPRQIELVNILLERLEPLDLKIKFYNKLTREAFNYYNKILLDELSAKGHPFNFEKAIAELDQDTIQQLRTLDSSKVNFIQNRMVNFVKGYGHINYNDALLTLAQRRSRKDYEFNPVLINQAEEVTDFFDILAATQKPVLQSFVYASSHFVSGLISIDEMGKAKIILIDSLGAEECIYHEDFLRNFSKHFPNNEIYVSKESRQKTSKGCSVFALDDIAHLPKIRIEGHENIWDYLEETEKKVLEIEPGPDSEIPIIANSIALPVSLMRTMQSSALLNDIIPQKPQNVQAFKINKKEQTTSESVMPFFKPKSHSEMDKLQNTRLDYKLDKMKKQNFQYLLSLTEAEVANEMEYFTIQSFASRTALQQSELTSAQHDLDERTLEELRAVRILQSDSQAVNQILSKEKKIINITSSNDIVEQIPSLEKEKHVILKTIFSLKSSIISLLSSGRLPFENGNKADKKRQEHQQDSENEHRP